MVISDRVLDQPTNDRRYGSWKTMEPAGYLVPPRRGIKVAERVALSRTKCQGECRENWCRAVPHQSSG